MVNIKKIVSKRIFFTLMIIFIYLLGLKIYIPNIKNFINIGVDSSDSNILNTLNSMTGGDLTSLSIFSLGLSPWMSTLIIWRVVSMVKLFKLTEISKKKQDVYQYLLAIFITILQSIVIIRGYEFTDYALKNYNLKLLYVLTILFLVSGTFVIIFLANMNTEYGMGGMMILLVVNIVSSWGKVIQDVSRGYYNEFINNNKLVLIFIAIFALIALLTTIILDRAEYRMKLVRILIDNKFSKKTYLPIKLNPTGGMAFMYGMSFMLLPRYIFIGLNAIIPNNSFIQWGINNLVMTRIPGIILYFIVIFVLSVAFGYMNVDIEKTSEGLKKAGDYLIDVRPGYNTEKYLYKRANIIIILASLYVTFFMGLPLLLLIGDPYLIRIAMIPGIIMMVAGITLNYTEEIDILHLTNKYNNKLF